MGLGDSKPAAATTTTSTDTSGTDIASFIKSENSSNKVVIWSKTYCRYCKATKELFQSLNVDTVVHELDVETNGSLIQSTLLDMTGQRTVPNVFINNQHVGGNDKVQEAHQSGRLQELLNQQPQTS